MQNIEAILGKLSPRLDIVVDEKKKLGIFDYI